MRVGFITQLLWSRYGPFWAKLFKEIGVEVVFADVQNLNYKIKSFNLKEVDGFMFRLAILQALSLDNVDLIIAPNINHASISSKGSAQDPWIANFPDTLAQKVKGLPPILQVPATLRLPYDELEKLVMQILYPLTRQANDIRRVWERHYNIKEPKFTEPNWSTYANKNKVLGVVGQPWLICEALVEALKNDSNQIIAQHQLDPNYLQQEGLRINNDLTTNDSEFIGAVHYLGRKGSINKLVMLADKTSGSDAWLMKRAKHLTHKPFTVNYIQDLMPANELADKLYKLVS